MLELMLFVGAGIAALILLCDYSYNRISVDPEWAQEFPEWVNQSDRCPDYIPEWMQNDYRSGRYE